MRNQQKIERFRIKNPVADLVPGDVFEQAIWNKNIFIWSRSPGYDKESEDSQLRGICFNNWGVDLEGNIEWIDPIDYNKSQHFKNRVLVKKKHMAWRQRRGKEKHDAHEAMVKSGIKSTEVPTETKRKSKRIKVN